MNTTAEIKNNTPKSSEVDQNDDKISRWGRERHEGFRVGKFVQSVPMFFTQDHHNLFLGDQYRGRTAFLILGGPSFALLDKEQLNKPGIITMGVNNSPKSYRPNMWCCVDSPSHFIRSIWLDPKIQKFAPICHAPKQIFNSDKWEYMNTIVGDCPNMVFYRRNEHFKAKQFLWEDTINWGNHKKHGGGRSVMLAAIRILFILGFRKIYLLGCDFTMDDKNKYHFDQDRKADSIKGNNSTYQKLNARFAELRPHFEKENFFIYNCNPNSGLKAFEFVEYDTAIRRALTEMDNVDIIHERTKGLYDTNDAEKKSGKGK